MVKKTIGVQNHSDGLGLSCCTNSLVEWLLLDKSQFNSISDFLQEICTRLVAENIPLWRMYCQIHTLHPQAVASSYTWQRDSDTIEVIFAPHGGFESSLHLDSPCAVIFDGASSIRRRLDISDPCLDFPILEDLHAQGATDYIAFPIKFSDGQLNLFSVTTDISGGFKTEELQQLIEILPILTLRLECMIMRVTALTLLDTYLGQHSGERVLNGLIKRGDGEDLYAVVWFCDLRDSTRLSSELGKEEFLAVLNDFFDCMGGAVVDHGGEILRFIGDAMLAIFPIGETTGSSPRKCCSTNIACCDAITAAKEARTRMGMLNLKRIRDKKTPLGFGIGLHIGDVIYGNIGIPQRLDFTVIGAAANTAARLESLTKVLGRTILVSEEFVQSSSGALGSGESFFSCGYQELRGIDGRHRVYALEDDS